MIFTALFLFDVFKLKMRIFFEFIIISNHLRSRDIQQRGEKLILVF